MRREKKTHSGKRATFASIAGSLFSGTLKPCGSRRRSESDNIIVGDAVRPFVMTAAGPDLRFLRWVMSFKLGFAVNASTKSATKSKLPLNCRKFFQIFLIY